MDLALQTSLCPAVPEEESAIDVTPQIWIVVGEMEEEEEEGVEHLAPTEAQRERVQQPQGNHHPIPANESPSPEPILLHRC